MKYKVPSKYNRKYLGALYKFPRSEYDQTVKTPKERLVTCMHIISIISLV
jgi:hypothetical protein